MKRRRRLVAILIFTVFLFNFWGCTTPAGRTTGEVIDDATITTKVKTKIFGDSVLKGFAISVETFQGEVTLTGGVRTQEEKDRAERIARDTVGVRKVYNLIKITK
ncbi:MAG: BON domain-containing protein [Pseudomonadota bacterium]